MVFSVNCILACLQMQSYTTYTQVNNVYRSSNTIKVWVTTRFFVLPVRAPSHHQRAWTLYNMVTFHAYVYRLQVILAKVHTILLFGCLREHYNFGAFRCWCCIAVKHISNFKVYNWVIYWPHVEIAIGGIGWGECKKVHDFVKRKRIEQI